MANDRHGAAFVVGAVIGGIVGAAATLWTTPRSGLELRTQLMGDGDDYAPGAPNVAVPDTAAPSGGADRLSSRALGFVERAAAPLVGVRLGETANERGASATASTSLTSEGVAAVGGQTDDTEEIVVAPGEASGDPAPGASGPGHVATPDELSSPVPGALDQVADDDGTHDRFTPFPGGDRSGSSS